MDEELCRASERVSELDNDFASLRDAESKWPPLLPSVKLLYENYFKHYHKFAYNLVCACCGCIFHSHDEMVRVAETCEGLMLLRIPDHIVVPFNFRCGIELLDNNRVLIDKLGVTPDGHILLCRQFCHAAVSQNLFPPEALCNYRWIGDVPSALHGLTWIEELLIARVHVCANIVRLGDTSSSFSYHGLKGHVVFLPQDTTHLLDILPVSPSFLPEIVKVVWVGRAPPNKVRLRPHFTVRKTNVVAALAWLVANNEDYKNVAVDEDMVQCWDSCFVAVELLDHICRVTDGSTEDASRDGFTQADVDQGPPLDEIPFTTSALLHTNDNATATDSTVLNHFADLKNDTTINVVTGSTVLDQHKCPEYFTGAFPTRFCFGTAKHIDPRRGDHELSLVKWTYLMLRHSSRRFQSHPAFVISGFDVARLRNVLIQSSVLTRSSLWPSTAEAISTLSSAQLYEAAAMSKKFEPIHNPAVRELLKNVAIVNSSVKGSDQQKKYMLTQLKSSIVFFGCPLIFLTINPNERDSAIALLYCGEDINVNEFDPKLYSAGRRLQLTLQNPVAVNEYFHSMVTGIIETMVKGGMFGEIAHYYGTIEYQGRGTPHMHLAVWIKGAGSPETIREKAKHLTDFRDRLVEYIENIASECLPEIDEDWVDDDDQDSDGKPSDQGFQPIPDPTAVDFNKVMQRHVNYIVPVRQLHSSKHTPSCFKYGLRRCRFRFPRKIVYETRFDETSGVVYIRRNDPYVNNYNPWFTIITRANHDVQFLFTKKHALAIVHYIMKYISKLEASLHSQLTVAAALQETRLPAFPPRSVSDIARSAIRKFANKLSTVREVGMPEAASIGTNLPDHYTSCNFENLNTTHLVTYMNRLCRSQEASAQSTDDGAFDSEIVTTAKGMRTVSFFDDYAHRTDALDSLCLYDYCANVYKRQSTLRSSGIPFSPDHPQYDSHCQFVRRDRKTVPALLGRAFFVQAHSDDPKKREDYFCIVSGLFFPWAGKFSPKSSDETWEQFVNKSESGLCDRVRRLIDNLALLYKSKEDSIVHHQQMKAQLDREDYAGHENDEDIDPDGDVVDLSIELSNVTDPLLLSNLDIETLASSTDYLDLYSRKGYDAWTKIYESADTCLPTAGPLSFDWNDSPIYPTLEELQVHVERLSNAADAAQSNSISTFIRDAITRQPDVYITDGNTDEPWIMGLIRLFNLNEEQERALRIVAYHTLGRSRVGDQLLLGIFGEGGTGKSTGINAIRAWFALKEQQYQLAVTATTGTAAFNIKGVTVHTACGMRRGRDTASMSIDKQKEWSPREYLIIDEVSMLDLPTLSKVDEKLRRAKCNLDRPFGGVNVIFIGDFLQIPAVSNLDLYEECPNRKGSDGLKCREAHNLWRSLNAVVVLTEQMRQSDDPELAAALRRIRIREPTEQDYILLHSRVGAHLDTTAEVPFVVRRHLLRYAINQSNLVRLSNKFNKPIVRCVADLKSKPSKMSISAALSVKGGSSKVTGDGILSVMPGAPLIVNKNINVSLGLVNGAMVEFYAFVDKDGIPMEEQFIKMLPAYMLIKVHHDIGVPIHLPGLPPGVLKLEPCLTTCNTAEGAVSFLQFPVSLAYAITDYKCQSKTLPWVVVDIASPPGFSPAASAYVQLSRATRRDQLSILREFTLKELQIPFSESLKRELEWQKTKAEETKLQYPCSSR